MGFRIAVRSLLRRPAISAAIVIAIALAIAVTCALFSVVDGLLFRPLPFRAADRLVAIQYRETGGRPSSLAVLPEFADRRDALRQAIESSPYVTTATQAGFGTFFRRDAATELDLEVTGVDSRFFPLLALSPVLGVDFSPDDERSPAAHSLESDSPLPVIIGHDLWRRLYGGTPGALGLQELAGRRVRIIGVMGPGVKFPGETNVWAPVPSVRNRPPAYARLKPGVTVEQLARMFPDLEVRPLRDATRTGNSNALVVIFVAAILLLLITWVQVAALMLSGTISRFHEVGVQFALGASRARLVRYFAIENALVAGTAFGLAWLTILPLTTLVVAVLPAELQRGQYLTPDIRTFLFSCVVSLLGLGLLTVLPVALVHRATPVGLLSGRVSARPLNVERWRHALLVGQMALTALLLYLAGLALHSFVRATTFDYGFDANNILVFTPPAWARINATVDQLHADFEQRNGNVSAAMESLRKLPGVLGVAGFFSGPLNVGITPDEAVPITSFDGRPRLDVRARANTVSSAFVPTLGAKILAGHGFHDPQYSSVDNVVLVNEALAKRFVPGLGVTTPQLWPTVVGREMQPANGVRARIIGVIKDLVQTGPAVPAIPEFFKIERRSSAFAVVAVRIQGRDDAELAVRAALQRIWGPFPPRQLRWMRDDLKRVLVPYRGQSALLGIIAALCLPIATIGLMGALTYSVRVRTREIAIRMAVGAEPNVLRRAVIRRSLTMVGIGIVLGTAMGAAVGSVVAHQLFEIHPADVSTMVGVAGGLIALGSLAAIGPARHAVRVEPAVALRDV